ncbi:MAG: hypothetical protein CUN55_11525 [Phototrophicales bacterium]|nr:MAG: hypothetical protein CUN55_11525 [Phototrophicales bacterium]
MKELEFPIQNAINYTCYIESFDIAHATLRIRLKHMLYPQTMALVFSWVRYWAGPVNWTGANFQIAKKEHCLAILRRLEHTQNMGDDFLINELGFRLYEAMTPSGLVQIVAREALLDS